MKALTAVALAIALTGCSRGATTRWIGQAREANAEADALLLAGSPDKAAQALDRARALPPPASLDAVDRRAVLQDLDARRALLALDAGSPKLALEIASGGLALGEERDVLTAALRILRGRANEALGHDADAARDYEAAQAIDEALLDELLRGQGKP